MHIDAAHIAAIIGIVISIMWLIHVWTPSLRSLSHIQFYPPYSPERVSPSAGVSIQRIPNKDSPEFDKWQIWLNAHTNRYIAIYDDNPPYGDEMLCAIHAIGDNWYIVYVGHTKTWSVKLGRSIDITGTHLWQELNSLWNDVVGEEGSIRRQD